MGPYSKRSIVILIAIVTFVYFGTPLLAELLFELYHLLKLDFLYTAYGYVRAATAQYMFSPFRWVITLAVVAVGAGILWLRQQRNVRKGAAK